MGITTYKDHPLSELLPLMDEAEIEELATDIRQHGQRAPITLYENKILDGRNRYRACKLANVEPKVRHFTGKDPIAFILSANVFRRHLTASQRALAGATMSNGSPHGGVRDQDAPVHLAPTISQAAKMVDVSPRTVATAREVLRTAPPSEIKKIQRGEKTVKEVARETKAKAKDKEEFLDHVGRTIPDDLISEWKRAEDVGKQLQSLARKIKSSVSEGFTGAKQDKVKDPIFAELTNSIISDAQALAWSLGSIIPFALCPTCQGRGRNSCALCRKRGWISKFLWNSPAVNEDVRKMIEKGKG